MKKFIISLSLIGAMTISSFAGTLFTDIENHWAKGFINKLTSQDIIRGYGDGTFRPDNQIKVSEFAVLVLKGDKVDIPKTELWYDGVVSAAKDKNIIFEGEFNDFTRPITRGEMTRMIVRALGEEESPGQTKFTDDSQIPSHIKGYVNKAVELGVLSGYPDGTFKSNGTATRAESSTVITKMIEILENDGEVVVPPTPKPDPKPEPPKEPEKGYNELSDFQSTPVKDIAYLKNIKFDLEEDSAKAIKNAYFLKKSDLPVKLGNVIITDIEMNEKKSKNERSLMAVSGYVVDEAISLKAFLPSFIESNNTYRYRQFLSFGQSFHDQFVNKYPNLKGLQEFEKNIFKMTTHPGEKFTYMCSISSSRDLDFDDNFKNFSIDKVKYIMFTPYFEGEDVIIFDNFLK